MTCPRCHGSGIEIEDLDISGEKIGTHQKCVSCSREFGFTLMEETEAKNIGEAIDKIRESKTPVEQKEPLKYRDIKRCATPGCSNLFEKKSNPHKYCNQCADKREKERLQSLHNETVEKRKGGNFLKPEKVEAVTKSLESGVGIRGASRETGVAKGTVTKIAAVIVAQREEGGQGIIPCECGKPAGHKGRCKNLLAKSPKRQEVMKRLHYGKGIQSQIYCRCGKPLFHTELCDYGVSNVAQGNVSFEDLIRQYGKYLEHKRDELQKEIEDGMAEWVKVNTRIVAFEEFMNMAGVDTESRKELIDDYYELHNMFREHEQKEKEKKESSS